MSISTAGQSPGLYEINVIRKSKGFHASNVKHSYDFTVNILSMNAKELLSAIDIVTNPEIMIYAFSEENKAASLQMHKEINRLVHNYLCALSSFADHTRKLMDDEYCDTGFYKKYHAEVQRLFNSDELCRFVRDLRNYMTHRGLPNSSMNLHMQAVAKSSSDDMTPMSVTTGVYYPKASLADWDGWKAPSKRYLSKAPDQLVLTDIFRPHFDIMKTFTDWFCNEFYEHHRADFEEFEEMIETRRKMEKDAASARSDANN